MRKIPLVHQTPDRHSPQHWLSGLLICLINVLSVAGIGFSLPTSQAASLAHPTRSHQSAPHVSQQSLHTQVSTQKAPQRHAQTRNTTQKVISHKTNAAPQRIHLKPHIRQNGAAPTPNLGLVITDNNSGSCIKIGTLVTYTFTITNNGTPYQSTAGPITVNGTLPAALSSPPSVDGGGNWSVTTSANSFSATYIGPFPINNGDSTAFTISGTVGNPAGTTLVTSATLTDTEIGSSIVFAAITTNRHATNMRATNGTSSNKTSTDIITVCRADLVISQTHSPSTSPLQVGQSIAYTLAVANTGPKATIIPAGEVITVVDTLPAGLTGVTFNGTGWTFSNTTTPLIATYTLSSDLAANSPLPTTFTITGTLSAGFVGTTITNTATASIPMDVLTAGETEQTSTDTIAGVAIPDLSANLTVTNAGCNSAPVSYALAVSDTAGAGPVLSATTPISVLISTPANLTGVTLSSTGGWSIAGLTATYTGTYPVTAGTTLPGITITGTPTLPTTSPIVLSAKVSIASGTTTLVDANPLNDTASNTLTICASDLAITNTHAGTAPFVVGQTIAYTLTVTNVSTVPVATGSPITVTDTLPAGLANPWAISSGWSLSITSGVLSGTYIGTYPVATGALPSITVSGILTNATGASLSNIATVTTPADGNLTNNTATDTLAASALPATAAPNVSVSFTHTGTACVANNGTVTYTLSVTNSATAGPIYAGQPVTVNATLPTNLTEVVLSTPGSWQLSYSRNVMTGIYNAPVASGGILPTITITGNLTMVNSATLTSTATVALANDNITTGKSATDLLTICTPDLAIVKTHLEAGPFKIGTTVTFQLAISNVGTAPFVSGQAITVIDPVPSDISSVTATGGTDWTVTALNNKVIATYIGTYPVAPTTNLTPILISGQISSLDHDTLINGATAFAPGDFNLKNNVSIDTIATPAYPNLSVRIGKPKCANKNDQASFTFTISTDASADPVPASAPVTLTFRDPIGLDQISYSGSNWTWKKDGSVITATYVHSQSIDPGSTLDTFTITGTVTKSHAENIWVGVRVYEHNDPDFNNDTAEDTLKVC